MNESQDCPKMPRTMGIQKHLETTKDQMIQLVYVHEQSKKLHSIKKESNKFATELNVEIAIGSEFPCTLQAKNQKRRAKQEGLKI